MVGQQKKTLKNVLCIRILYHKLAKKSTYINAMRNNKSELGFINLY